MPRRCSATLRVAEPKTCTGAPASVAPFAAPVGPRPATLLQTIDEELVACVPDARESHPGSMLRTLEDELSVSALRWSGALGQRVLTLLDGSPWRLEAATAALQGIIHQLGTIASELSELYQEIEQERTRIQDTLADLLLPSETAPEEQRQTLTYRLSDPRLAAGLEQYGLLRFLRPDPPQPGDVRDRNRPEAWPNSRASSPNCGCHCGTGRTVRQRAVDVTSSTSGVESQAEAAQQARIVAAAFDDRLRANRSVVLVKLLTAGRWRRRPFCRTPAEGSDQLPVGEYRRCSAERAVPSAGSPDIRLLEQSVMPQLSHAGGGCRMLAVVPKSAAPEEWQQSLETTCRSLCLDPAGSAGGLFLCREVEGLSLSIIEEEISSSRESLSQVADRLHTRTDVEW